jgi:ABC-type polysaccharide/polyol phosphate transport system ATPase subunit
MSTSIISVENLSKRYLVGHRGQRAGQASYTALREVIGQELRNFGRKASDLLHGRQVVQGDTIEEFWALKDVNFEVREGEVLGIIGRNGAGKSTLLKVLSRITEPTKGRVTLRGRVASLLEVGTGFHPELTGRENIFLNGAILGMSRSEIRRKFDEIVAFAEIERFLDTPVKRYSSGMYVRLAFAVAAHLEPEILIVDEVLAVGDFEFQKKCLGKMNDVSRRDGRTVLFVSHNMEAVLNLCARAVLLGSGQVVEIGDAASVVARHLSRDYSGSTEICLKDRPRPSELPNRVRLSAATTIAPQQNWVFSFGQFLSFDIWIDSTVPLGDAELGIGLFSAKGYEIASWSNACSGEQFTIRPGVNAFRVEYQDLTLLPGQYSIGVGIRPGPGRDLEDYLPEAILFEVAASTLSAEINGRAFGGSLVPRVALSPLVNALPALPTYAGVEEPG